MNDSMKMVQITYKAMSSKLAEDITVIDISKISPIADYFMIAAGTNTRQVQALADEVLEKLGRAGYPERSMEGYQTANWILIDYNDIVVHIFNREDRRFYDLERIWRDGLVIDNAVLEESIKAQENVKAETEEK